MTKREGCSLPGTPQNDADFREALVENCARVCDSLAQYWMGKASFKRGRALQDAAVRIRASAHEWATLWEKNTDYMPFPMPPRESVALSENAAIAEPRYVGGFCQDREKCLTMKADALRYRFWRRHWTAEDEGDFDKLNDILGKANVDTPDQVDAALDAAIKESQ